MARLPSRFAYSTDMIGKATGGKEPTQKSSRYSRDDYIRRVDGTGDRSTPIRLVTVREGPGVTGVLSSGAVQVI